jgi:precorrin-2/cobalt-factor-2 C20-methyltransferase
MMGSGKFYIVGLGPGDPELMTVKAARIIASAGVVAFFAKQGRPGHARSIVADQLGPHTQELRFEYPFTLEVAVDDPRYLADMGNFYETCAATLSSHLRDGQSVALLCEGDPFLYGSAMYLFDRLRTTHPPEIIPGVTGMSGCWTRANTPITHGDDVLSIMPGTLDEASLTARLKLCDAAVIMKVGRNLAKIRNALAQAGLFERAIYVERGTMHEERILPLSQLDETFAPYFSMVLVPGRQRAR